MKSATAVRLLFDADVLVKLSILDCFAESISALGYTMGECATMRSMTRSAGVDDQVVRERRAGGPGKPARRLFKTLKAIPTIDKMAEEEKELAAAVTGASVRLGLPFDGGEALLVSVAVFRGLPFVTTGDKKAIACLPALAECVGQLEQLKGKLLPLEHLLIRAIRAHGLAVLYPRFDAGKGCDAAVQHVIAAAGNDEAAFIAELDRRLASLRIKAPGFVPAT
jgi:hypothetical protein